MNQKILIAIYMFLPSGREGGLYSMVEKIVARGHRALVVVDDDKAAGAIDDFLWQAGDDSFIPHGVCGVGDNGQHGATPIVITHAMVDDNLLQDDIIFFLNSDAAMTTWLQKILPSPTAKTPPNQPSGRRIFLWEQGNHDHQTLLARLLATTTSRQEICDIKQYQQHQRGGWQE